MIDLEQIEKTEHYEIPENYFEELPGRVMQNIKREQNRRRNILSGSIAAVAVIAIAAGIFLTYNTDRDSAGTAKAAMPSPATEEEILESLATDYYSEELALMDYYQYVEY
jgi:hypothetical protein